MTTISAERPDTEVAVILFACPLRHDPTLQDERLPTVTEPVTMPRSERTSQKPLKAKFAEFTFHALR